MSQQRTRTTVGTALRDLLLVLLAVIAISTIGKALTQASLRSLNESGQADFTRLLDERWR